MRIVSAVLTATMVAGAVYGQSFEVSSIRPNNSGDGSGSSNIKNGRYIGHNVNLRDLIEHGYDVMEWQIIGPDWIRSERFDVTAKPPDGAPEEQFEMMMQNLLAERFKLRVHKEMREHAVYELVAAKGGLKAVKAPDDGHANTNWSRNRISAQHMTMAHFAERLSRVADRPVVDRTGIAGAFNFDLKFTPDTGQTKAADSPDDAPSLFTALDEQLGLKLQPAKARVEFLVVDSAEHAPTEN